MTGVRLETATRQSGATDERTDLKTLDDAALVAEYLGGRRRAFHELADRYHLRLLNFIYRTIGDRDRAEDLVVGNPDIVEDELGGVGATPSVLVELGVGLGRLEGRPRRCQRPRPCLRG